jgi:hypothetical protein
VLPRECRLGKSTGAKSIEEFLNLPGGAPRAASGNLHSQKLHTAKGLGRWGSADGYFSVAVAERPWAFDGNGEDFKLAVEAKRIDLAFLFDPVMAVHTSSVQPLPHQIAAVYESMLPRQPLRYVLADDPGAGKTIMAGLYIRELLMRADARRVLIISPGSLTEQWRDELYEKFGLEFQVFSKESLAAHPNGNPFESLQQLKKAASMS